MSVVYYMVEVECCHKNWVQGRSLYTEASSYVVVGALSFPSSLHTMKSIGLDPLLLSTSNHFTAGHGSSKPQRDMSVKKGDVERKEGGAFKDVLSFFSSPLLPFSEGGEQGRRWRRREACCCNCNQGAVRTLTLTSPLVSPLQIC